MISVPRFSGSAHPAPRPPGDEPAAGSSGSDRGAGPPRDDAGRPSPGPPGTGTAPLSPELDPGTFAPRVLVAEDNRDLQQILAHQLVLLGLQVLGVSNGRDAVDLALSALRAGHPFDLILMDLEMPVLDGYQAARQVRDGGYAGPILALTAHSGDDSRLDCLETGCDDCLGKPFDWGQLRSLLRKYLPGISFPGAGPTRHR